MRLGVDATNITSGGGLTHLVAFLDDVYRNGRFSRVIVWGASATFGKLPEAPEWAEYRTCPALNGNILQRLWWTSTRLHREAEGQIDLLFVPGSLYLGGFRPFVTMCRNMLPFDPEQRARFGVGRQGFRLRALRFLQGLTFKRATRLIFLSTYASDEINRQLRLDRSRQSIVAHGIADYFRDVAVPYDGEQKDGPVRLLYVSTLMPYKYQLELVKAVCEVNGTSAEVELHLVGDGDDDYLHKVRQVIADNGADDTVIVHGLVAHNQLPDLYRSMDAVIYASGCENFPNILVEAMATGLPLLSSNKGPMPEILGENAIYFDPSDSESVVQAIHAFLAMKPEERSSMASGSHACSQQYTWSKSFRLTNIELEKALLISAPRGTKS